MGHLIRYSDRKPEAKKLMGEQLASMTSVICQVVKTSDTWGKKKTSKTAQCVNLYIKAARSIKEPALSAESGAKLIKTLEEACESDKAMANLKGKIKEIKSLV